jgi:hypothetical protein
VQLAYSAIGAGPPLVKTGNWMTHLEYDLESPDLAPCVAGISQGAYADPL